MTTPGGVPNLPPGALTLYTIAGNLQDMSATAMKSRAVERFPGIFDNSTGLSPASDITPFGLLTTIWSQVNSLIANADPADINGPEDLPELVLDFIEGLPFVGQFVGLVEAILGTYDGTDEMLLTIQRIFAPVREFLQLFTGITTNGFPTLEEVTAAVGKFQNIFAELGPAISTAITSANQATDVARQLATFVVQSVSANPVAPFFGDIAQMINAVGFWFLGLVGVANQANSNSNPAVAAALGRVSALESLNVSGLEGMADHFNRPAIGADWADISPWGTLTIKNGAYLKSYDTRAGRYVAKTLLTDTWHVQCTLVDIDYGASLIYVSCPPSTTNAGFNNGFALEMEHFWYGDVFSVYTLGGGLTTGVTLQHTVQWDLGNFKLGDVLAVEYSEADNAFYVFHNNDEIADLRFPDVSNVVSHGSGHREIAVLTNKSNNVQFSGPGFDDFSAYDIKTT